VGLAPTGKRRLVTAHTQGGHPPDDRLIPVVCHFPVAARSYPVLIEHCIRRGPKVFEDGLMKRRDFITLRGGAAAAWPLATHAQQPTKLLTIGILGSGTPEVQGVNGGSPLLSDCANWVGSRVATSQSRIAGQSAIPRLQPSSSGSTSESLSQREAPPSLQPGGRRRSSRSCSRRQGTRSAPVWSLSLARPGGNVTGLSIQQTNIAAKRLELLREVVPGLRRPVILANIGTAGAVLDMDEVEATTRKLGLEATKLQIRRAEDIVPGFDEIKGRTDALYVVLDPLINTNRIRINSLALGARLPTIHSHEGLVEAGV
jgi:putative tryptophan/tyrosine transport system substrate-binding protein